MTRWLELAKVHANTLVFAAGLALLCTSVAAWSPPTAGVILGCVLMTIAAWPYLFARKH